MPGKCTALIAIVALMGLAAPRAVHAAETEGEAAQHLEVGKGHFEMGDYKNALTHFKKAFELDPGSPEASKYLKKTRSVLELSGGGPRPSDYMAQQAIAVQMHRRELVNAMAWAKELECGIRDA